MLSTIFGRQKHPILWFLLLSTILAIGLLSGSYLIHQREYSKTEISARQSALSYAMLTEALLRDMDRAISQATSHHLAHTNGAQSRILNEHLLAQRRITNPLIMDWLILDATGKVEVSSGALNVSNAQDQDYYRHHLNNPDSSLYITPPRPSSSNESEWYIALSHAIRDVDGQLKGVGVALVSIARMQEYFAEHISGPDLSITMLHQQKGDLVIRAPETEHAPGENIANVAGLTFPLQAATTREIPRGLDGARRLASFQPLEGLNLVVVGSRNLENALTVWRDANVMAATTWLLGSLLGLALALQTGRAGRKEQQQQQLHLAEQRRLNAALSTSEQKFRMLVENASDIIYTLDQHGKLTYVSPNWESILGHPVEEVTGKNIEEFLHPNDLPRCYDYLQRALHSAHSLESIEYQVKHRNGKWRWHAAKGRRMPHTAEQTEVFLGIARDIHEQKLAEQKLIHMAHYDPLTDLPNRSMFFSMAEHALHSAKRQQSQFALIFVDLDHFKPVNDELGHAAGDQLLQLVAQRLQDCLRASDTVGRIGGDEFFVLLHRINTFAEAKQVAEKILAAIQRPYKILNKHTVEISCSIGIALYPDDGQDLGELSRRADQAMYQVKDSGRCGIRAATSLPH